MPTLNGIRYTRVTPTCGPVCLPTSVGLRACLKPTGHANLDTLTGFRETSVQLNANMVNYLVRSSGVFLITLFACHLETTGRIRQYKTLAQNIHKQKECTKRKKSPCALQGNRKSWHVCDRECFVCRT